MHTNNIKIYTLQKDSGFLKKGLEIVVVTDEYIKTNVEIKPKLLLPEDYIVNMDELIKNGIIKEIEIK